MLRFPRSLARTLRAVFRKLPTTVVRLSAGPDGLRFRAAGDGVTVEYQHPGPAQTADLLVPLELLTACEGRSPEPVTVQLSGGRVEVRWQHQGATQFRAFSQDQDRTLPDLPIPARFTRNGSDLRAALAEATRTAAEQSNRYALRCLQLRGERGEVVATNGKQLYIHGGFTFPWQKELLIPAHKVLSAKELPSATAIEVARAEQQMLFRLGPWTLAFQVQEGRYPNVDAVLPQGQVTTWHFLPREADTVRRELQQLSGAEKEHAPLVLELGPTVRAGSVTGRQRVVLPGSVEGPPLTVRTARGYLLHALDLGLNRLTGTRPEQPLAATDGRRTLVWMTLLADSAEPAAPKPARAKTAPSKGTPRSTPRPPVREPDKPRCRLAPSPRLPSKPANLEGWLLAPTRSLFTLVQDCRRRQHQQGA